MVGLVAELCKSPHAGSGDIFLSVILQAAHLVEESYVKLHYRHNLSLVILHGSVRTQVTCSG